MGNWDAIGRAGSNIADMMIKKAEMEYEEKKEKKDKFEALGDWYSKQGGSLNDYDKLKLSTMDADDRIDFMMDKVAEVGTLKRSALEAKAGRDRLEASIFEQTLGKTGGIPQTTKLDDVINRPAPNVGVQSNKGMANDWVTSQVKIGPITKENLAADKAKIKGKAEAELESDVLKGRLVNTNNLDLISGVMRDLSEVYADAYKEGGAGGAIQAGKAWAANKIGDLPGGVKVGSKFPASGAFPGKRMELVLKLMPMLTQQATKPEGSVRIITGVLDALGVTIPELSTAPATALRQLQESQRTFYRFAKAAEQMGMSLDEVFKGQSPDTLSEDQIKTWARMVARNSDQIAIKGDEKKYLDTLMENTFEPIENILNEGGPQIDDVFRGL